VEAAVYITVWRGDSVIVEEESVTVYTCQIPAGYKCQVIDGKGVAFTNI
jgi:hypothetical protein